jgi:UDPglucose 6-dehydrogenase
MKIAMVGSGNVGLVTGWVRNPNFGRLRRLLHRPMIFDGYNLYDPADMKRHGFIYCSIGRGRG